jgi:hypothetical protein
MARVDDKRADLANGFDKKANDTASMQINVTDVRANMVECVERR